MIYKILYYFYRGAVAHSHRLVAALLLLGMGCTRLIPYYTSETVSLRGVDAWYHQRMAMYTATQWPATLSFDPWTGYPDGAIVGQFGTPFDQFVAAVALLLGGGTPTVDLVRFSLALTPVLFALLTALPTYYLSRWLGDGNRWVGVVGILVLAVLPGEFFRRTVFGFGDHHAAEVFLMATSGALLLAAFAVAQATALRYTDLWSRAVLSSRAVRAALASGVVIGLYLLIWPPGVLFVGVLGVFLVVHTIHRRSDPWARLAPPFVVLTVSLGTALGVVLLIAGDAVQRAPTPAQLSMLQLGVCGGLASSGLFIHGGRRVAAARGWSHQRTQGAVLGAGLLGSGCVVWAPELVVMILGNTRRLFGLWWGGQQALISETQPLVSPDVGVTLLLFEYGLLFSPALLGFGLTVIDALVEDDTPRLFLSVWAAVIGVAAFTQLRFNYYFAVLVAVFAAFGLARIATEIGVCTWRPSRDQLLIGAALVVVFVPSTLYLSYSVQVLAADNPGYHAVWDGPLEWIETETPAEGDFRDANNTAQFEYLRPPTADRVVYPNGTYGIVSWWDYGHWITVESQRIAVANPFQQQRTETATYLLAQNESVASQTVPETNHTTSRYLIIDWAMVDPTQKARAISAAHPTLTPDALAPQTQLTDAPTQGTGFATRQQAYRPLRTQRYYDSLMVRLYYYHGSAMTPPAVVTPTGRSTETPITLSNQTVTQFPTTAAAQRAAAQTAGQTRGGVGRYPRTYVPALSQYRLVYTSETTVRDVPAVMARIETVATTLAVNTSVFLPSNPSFVKVFERVPGATVQGTAPADTTVVATVTLKPATATQSFVYTQRTVATNGTFEMTVPYATTGYAAVGPQNGYTNTSIRATGGYTFRAVGPNGTLAMTTQAVSEQAVVTRTAAPVQVNLTQPGG